MALSFSRNSYLLDGERVLFHSLGESLESSELEAERDLLLLRDEHRDVRRVAQAAFRQRLKLSLSCCVSLDELLALLAEPETQR